MPDRESRHPGAQRPSRKAAEGPPRPAVVGIGASAGGLAALRRFLGGVPAGSGLAWVVVVHLDPEHESHLADLLQPHVALPVEQVAGTVAIEPDHVYVIPPGANLGSVDSHLRVSELDPARHLRAPIDHFFRALAATHDGHAIGVILTGTGSDGALGVKAIKERQGFTVVQDPATAEYDGMPRSAIATGLVDRVLPLEEIPGAILGFTRTQPRVSVPADGQEPGAGEREILQKIFARVSSRTGRDFSRYKRSTLLRRIQRRMQLRQVERLEGYLDVLRADPTEVRELADDILITVTNFFRDPEIWRHLESEVIPGVFDDRAPDESIRAWSVGCATGEEAYSLAMLLVEEAERRGRPPRIQVFASDLHERSLERGREGFYPGDIEVDVSPERLRRFFHREDLGYRVRKRLRELVVFAPHNLLGDPPFSRLDLIACRNLMIYLQREVQRDIIEIFHYALRPEGALVLGTSETVDGTELFRVESKEHHVFRKRNVPAPEPRLRVFPLSRPRVVGEAPGGGDGPVPLPYGAVHQRLVEQYAPPSMLVSPDGRVVHLSENVGRYLEIPGGEPTTSAFRLVREPLRLELRAALHAARDHGVSTRSKPIPLTLGGARAFVALDVRPARDPEHAGFALVTFDERPAVEVPPTRSPGGEGDARLREMDAELEQAKQRLQAMIDEYETGQEETKASHEELQSANEELRSTLEELETSKEELQSTNEELQTVNQENRHRVAELSLLSADLQNLLASTQIATLFLDRELRILRFTPQVGEIFNVRPVDRGRPLSDLTHRLGYDELNADAAGVLRSLVPVEREVADESGRWYMTRVLPYRSAQDRIEGVVITFVDITGRRRAEEALRASEARLRRMTNVTGVGVMIFSADGTLLDCNDAFLEMTGYTRLDVEQRRLDWRMMTPEEFVAESEARLGALERTDRIGPFEKECLLADGSRSWMLFAGAALGDGGIVEYCIDISDRKRAEAALLELNETLEQRVEERTRAAVEQEERLRTLIETSSHTVWTTDAEGRVVEDSPTWRAFTGQTVEEWLADGWSRVLHPDDREAALERWRHSLATGEPLDIEIRLRHGRSGTWRWANTRAAPLRGEDGVIHGWIGMNIDIDERKRAEAARAVVMQQLVTAEEEERRRISRELHDQMGQLVTALRLQLRASRDVPDGPERTARLEELEQLADRLARDLQHLALELRPPALDNLGLAPALRNHVEAWADRTGIAADFHSVGLDGQRFPPEVESSLYRVAQEALTNVLKHAGARRVSLILEWRRGVVTLIVEDDGAGFDVDRWLSSPSRRLGLRGMRERMALLGGTVEIESSTDAGTTVFARVPTASSGVAPASGEAAQ